MKNSIKYIILFLALIATSATNPKQANAQQFGIGFQTFYDELSPYGEWVDYPKYGYVWIPYVDSDFVPYATQGQWVYTEYGWTWVSNYNWGWAPFHYGRWDYDNYYGWLWVPDNQWGPSWVTWIRSDGYYGWQPMQPGISISLSFGGDYRTNYDHWTFIRDRDFERNDIQRFYIDRSDHERILRNHTVINQTYKDRRRNTTYISGPSKDDVQRVTGTRIKSVTIRENNRPGQNLSNSRLNIYRPEVKQNSVNEHQAAPSRVVNLKDVKRPTERNTNNQSREINPANKNRDEQQRNTVTPKNKENKKIQPTKQRQRESPANMNKKEQRQNEATPQDHPNQVQPTPKKNVIPPDNKRQEQLQKTVTPKREIKKAQPAQRRNVKQTENKNQVKPTRSESQNNKKRKQTKASNSNKK